MDDTAKRGFFDELEKISKKRKGPTFRTAIAAHELGHAQDYESSKIPTLRSAARTLGPHLGVGLGLSMARKSPWLGAGAALAGMSPVLADEGIASFNAMKALKQSGKYSPEEMKRMRNQLLQAGGTYLSGALGTAGAVAALGKKRVDLAQMAGAAGSLGALGSAIAGAYSLEGSPKSRMADLQQIRKGMGVKAKIHQAKTREGFNLGGRWSEMDAAYVPRTKSKPLRMILEGIVGDRVKGSPKKLQKIISEGGVLLPQTKV